jgi:hypothetical protein
MIGAIPGCEPSPAFDSSRRLWSLWDNMKPFNAALFMKFMEAVGMTRAIDQFRGGFPLKRDFILNDVSDGWVADWLKLMDLYEQSCVEMELTASVATIRKLRAALSKANPLTTDINPLTTELGGRLHDEMTRQIFLVSYYK